MLARCKNGQFKITNMKQIQGYVNYFIDVNGKIYNSITKKYINSSNNHSGYKVITLYKNGIKQYRLNRLVAECYLPNLGDILFS